MVGLSGGVDSVVLLHRVRAIVPGVAAIHVHHGLSPAADRWEVHCRELCAEWRIPLAVERVEVERGSADGLEAAARRARHAVFARLDADWLLLAHHQGDRAETLLFNLLRGAGVRGAGAMAERSGRLLRPLLAVSRPAIADYAREHGLTWVEDPSNADTRFSRNFLRHRILPELHERFPAAEERLAKAAARFAEASELLDQLALIDLAGERPEFPVRLDLLAALPEARARNLLRFLLARQGIGIPSEERLAEALRQCLAAAPDRHPSVCFGRWRLCREGALAALRED